MDRRERGVLTSYDAFKETYISSVSFAIMTVKHSNLDVKFVIRQRNLYIKCPLPLCYYKCTITAFGLFGFFVMSNKNLIHLVLVIKQHCETTFVSVCGTRKSRILSLCFLILQLM